MRRETVIVFTWRDSEKWGGESESGWLLLSESFMINVCIALVYLLIMIL